MSYKTLSKEHITESDIVEQSPIVIENIKWSALTSDQSVFKNTQRIIEDMMDVGVLSRIRNGCEITNTDSTIHLAAGNLMINGRWLRQASSEDFTTTQLSGTVTSGNRLLVAKILESADDWQIDGNLREVENESFVLVEKAITDTIEDDEILLATYTRAETTLDISSIINVHTTGYPETRVNDIIAKNSYSVRIKSYKGEVIAEFNTSGITFNYNVDLGSNNIDVYNFTADNDALIKNNLIVSGSLAVDTIILDNATSLSLNSMIFDPNKITAQNGSYIDFDTSITISGAPITLNDNVTITAGKKIYVNEIDDVSGGIVEFTAGTTVSGSSAEFENGLFQTLSVPYGLNPSIYISSAGQLSAFNTLGNVTVTIDGDTGISTNWLTADSGATINGDITISGLATFSGNIEMNQLNTSIKNTVGSLTLSGSGINIISPTSIVLNSSQISVSGAIIEFGEDGDLKINANTELELSGLNGVRIPTNLYVDGEIITTTSKSITLGGFGAWHYISSSIDAPNDASSQSFSSINASIFQYPFWIKISDTYDCNFSMTEEDAFGDLTGDIILPDFHKDDNGIGQAYFRTPFKIDIKSSKTTFKGIKIGVNAYCIEPANWDTSSIEIKVYLYQWYANATQPYYGTKYTIINGEQIAAITSANNGWGEFELTGNWNSVADSDADDGCIYLLELFVNINNQALGTLTKNDIHCKIGRIVIYYDEKI